MRTSVLVAFNSRKQYDSINIRKTRIRTALRKIGLVLDTVISGTSVTPRGFYPKVVRFVVVVHKEKRRRRKK